jgi:pimeloyl-ACP methyl ester carboxylesterase
VKPPLLLLHGAIGSGRQFNKLLPVLSEYDVHVFTFPGHGGKEIPAEGFSIELFADSVHNYLKEKNLESVFVFGYSMGGYVALYLASRYPNLFKKIITLGTKMEWTPEIAARETSQLNAEKIEAKVPAFAEALKQLHSPQDWKIVLQKTSEMLAAMGERPPLTKEDFQKIKIPVVVGLGDADKMVSREESERVVKYLPDGKFLLLENTEHPLERVDVNVLKSIFNQLLFQSSIH